MEKRMQYPLYHAKYRTDRRSSSIEQTGDRQVQNRQEIEARKNVKEGEDEIHRKKELISAMSSMYCT
jgi:hypothetical protein